MLKRTMILILLIKKVCVTFRVMIRTANATIFILMHNAQKFDVLII